MLFALVNSGASFCRLIRIILSNLPNVDSFVDDMWISTDTWKDHMSSLRQVLNRLRSAKLTAKPSKCMIVYDSIDCLGHNIVGQTVRRREKKIQAIRDAPRPTTNRQIKSFLVLLALPSLYSQLLIHSFSFDGLNKEEQTEFYQILARSPCKDISNPKNRITCSPILRYVFFRRVIRLFSDRTLQISGLELCCFKILRIKVLCP